jgi:uncharacterized protein (DUF1499 family)
MLLALKWLVAILVALIVLAFLAGQMGWLRGSPPPDLGVKDGRLRPPSNTENSVSSQAGLYPDHPMGVYAEIAPFAAKGGAAATLARIKQAAEAMEGAEVIKSETNYLHVAFTTKWMKFTDDAEFLVDDKAGVVHVRSAARLGRKDFGNNRRRIEQLRAAIGG